MGEQTSTKARRCLKNLIGNSAVLQELRSVKSTNTSANNTDFGPAFGDGDEFRGRLGIKIRGFEDRRPRKLGKLSFEIAMVVLDHILCEGIERIASIKNPVGNTEGLRCHGKFHRRKVKCRIAGRVARWVLVEGSIYTTEESNRRVRPFLAGTCASVHLLRRVHDPSNRTSRMDNVSKGFPHLNVE